MAAEPSGPPITDPAVEVHRQIRPAWWKQEGRPSSQNFLPMPKDEGLLSLADGRQHSAEEAHRFAVEVQDMDSLGSWTIPVRAFNERSVTVYEDPTEADSKSGLPADPAHASADYRALTDKQQRRLATALAAWPGAEVRAASGLVLPTRPDAASETA